jgi:hypothetical protein
MSPETAALLCSALATAAAVVGWVRERRLRRYRNYQFESALALLQRTSTRANRAENACEELRASVMRGSAIMRVKLRSAHHAADHELEIAVIEGTPHAFTDSVLLRAKSVYERAVANGQIDPIK